MADPDPWAAFSPQPASQAPPMPAQSAAPQTIGTPHLKTDAGYRPLSGGGEEPVPGGPADPKRPGGELDPSLPKNARLNPDALDAETSTWIITGQMSPLGMGGGPLRVQIENNRPVLMQKYGISDAQLPAIRSEFKADTNAYNQRVGQASFVNQAIDAAQQHIHQISGYLNHLPAQTDYRGLNAVSNFAQRQASGETITNLDATVPLLEGEVARIMTGNPNSGAGQLTDEARQEFDILRSNASPEAKIGAMNAIVSMAKGKISGVNNEIQSLSTKLNGGLAGYSHRNMAAAPGMANSPATPPPPAAPPSPSDPTEGTQGGFSDELTFAPKGAQEWHDAVYSAIASKQIKSVDDLKSFVDQYNQAHGTDFAPMYNATTAKAIALARAGKQFGLETPLMSQTARARMQQREADNATSPRANAVEGGALDSATLGGFTRASAAADATGDFLTGKGFDYTGNLNADQSYVDSVRQQHPNYFLGGQLAGALALPTGGARTVPEFARLGATYGGIYGGMEGGNKPLVDRATNALYGAGVGAAVPFALKGVGQAVRGAASGVNKMLDVLPQKAAPEFSINPDELAQAGQQEGVTVNRAMVDPSLQNKVTAVGKTMIGSRPLQSGMRDIGNQIEGKVSDLGQGGNALEPQTMGSTIAGAGMRYITQTGQQFNRLYGSLQKATEGIKITPAQALLDTEQMIGKLSETPNQNANELNFLTGLKSDLSKGLSIDALRGMRTKLRQNIANGNLTFGADEGRVLSIMDAASQDITNGLKGAGKGAIADRFAQVDAAYRDRMGMIQGTIQKLIGKRGQNVSGEQVYANLKSMAGPRGDASGLTRMMEQMTPEERNDMAATFADALGKNQAGDFSTAFLAKRVNSMPQAMRVAVFGPEGAQSLNNLGMLAKAHARVTNSLGGSPTGLANDYRGWLTDLVLGGGVGLLTESGGKGAAMAVAAGAVKATRDVMNARMLLSPDIQKWLRSAPATTSQRAIDVHFARLNSIAARNPGLAHDIGMLKQAIMGAANSNSPISGAVAASPEQGPDQQQ